MVNIIPLISTGESSTVVDLGDSLYTFVTRYNYSAECWTLDIMDSDGNDILLGLMLVPSVDILKPYPQEKQILGTLQIVEKYPDAYKNSDSLGTDIQLLWAAPGEVIDLT